ncbi:MAG: DUF1569 domain-containing protein [Ferruginibacter sp.]
MKKLEIVVNTIESKIEYAAILHPAISTSSVGWHIQHVLLTINQIINTIQQSDPSQYKPKFTPAKLLIFTFKRIPRGKVQAPHSVRPAENFNVDDINSHLTNCYSLLKILPSFNENNFFEHPFFGHLNVKASVKFLEIHTAHHLRIILDILKATNS